jgi:EmrB/QacA subfamily drug resistance transporter
VAGAGGAVGVLLGGILTAELSWRWVLYVNVPIGIGVFVAAVLYLTEAVRPELRQKLDVAGAITVTAGLFCLVYAIVGTDVHAWTSPQTLGFLGAAVVLLGAFALIETKLASHPLVPFRLFKSRALTGANTVIFLVGAVFFSLWYFLSLYLQTVLHYGALKTGMAFLPMAIGIIIGAQLAGRRLATSGPRPLLLVGMVIVTGGFFWLSKIGVDSDYWTHILPPGMMISFGVGLVFAPLASAATAGVAPTEAGLASALLVTFRQVGGSLGLAVLATIATDQTKSSLSSGLDAALASGYAKAFAVAAGLAAAAIACSFIVPARRRTAEAPARQVEAPPAEGSVNPALEG